jgi:lambda family phage tail tape measure protein
MTTIAQLGFKIDSSDAKTAKSDLDNLAGSASKLESSTSSTTSAFAKAGEAIEEFGEHAQRHILTLASANTSTRAFVGILARLPVEGLLAGAAVAALATAYIEGASRAADFAKAIAQSGDVAGVTAGQLQVLADKVAASTSANSGQTSDILSKLTGSGVIQGQDLQSFAATFVNAQKTIGTTSDQFIKNLQDLSTQPIQAAAALHILTPALYDQITAFQKQGDTFVAAEAAQQAYITQLGKDTQSVSQYTNVFVEGWRTALQAVKDTYNAVVSLGDVNTAEKQLANLEKIKAAGQNMVEVFNAEQVPGAGNIDQQIAGLQKTVAGHTAAAQAAAKDAQAQSDFLAGIQLAAVKAQAAMSTTNSVLQGSIQAIQDAEQGQLATSKAQGELLDAQHQAMLISDQQYYAAKKTLVETDAATQVKALSDQIAAIRQAGAAQDAEFAILRDPRNNPAAATPVGQANINVQQQAAQLQRGQQIANLVSQIAQLKEQAGAQGQVIDTQEQGSLRETAARYQQIVDVAQLYIKTQQQRYQNDELSVGLGQKEQQQLQDQLDIQRQFDDARKRITGQAATGALTKDQAAQDLKAEDDAQAASESAFKAHYAKLDQLQGDWVNGARQAFQDYRDQAADIAGLTDKAFTNSFQSIEDSLVNLVTTGKFSFKDLADSILSDLARLEIKVIESQALSAIFGAFSGDFGASGFGAQADTDISNGFTLGSIPAAAGGGPISGPTLVGERGPEIFVPNQSGYIVPNDKLGSAMGSAPTIQYSPVYHIGSGVNRAQVIAAVEVGHKRTMADMTRLIRGGAFR